MREGETPSFRATLSLIRVVSIQLLRSLLSGRFNKVDVSCKQINYEVRLLVGLSLSLSRRVLVSKSNLLLTIIF